MKKAFLLGINTYPGAPLSGCVEDVTNAANFLVDEHKVREDDVRLLTDARATKAAIMDRLNWLVQCEPGDQIYFHYSGHGTQVADRNHNAEVDGLDEVICPVDFAWDPNFYITDKELVAIFSKIPAGVSFNWCSDSCHSGDLTRDMPAHSSRNKFISPPADLAWRIRTARNKSIISSRSRGMIGNMLDVGFISGCRSDQTSADTVINGRPCGAFTYYLLKNLRAMKDKPLKDVTRSIVADLAANGYTQQPQAEGARITLPFWAPTTTPKRWVIS